MKQRWEEKMLGDVCDVIGGGTPSKANNKFYNGDIPWATVRDMKCEIVEQTEHKITKEAVKNSSTNVIPKGNVIIATRVGLGKACLLKNDTAINQDLRGIVPKNSSTLSVGYLFQWLKSIAHIIEKEGTGATVQGVKLPFIKSLLIPLPSIHEQNRIVKVLDEVFEKTTRAKENAKKNLQNARELFESYLQSIFASPGDDWQEKKLGDVCEYFNGKAHEQCIDEEGQYIVINSKFISSDGRVFKRTNDALFPLSQGDIAMVLSDVPNGKALAKCYLIEKDGIYSLNQRICAIRSDKFYTKFLYYQLNRNKHFLSFDNGENQTNLRLNQILSCPLYLPSISEQEDIASKLEAFSEETKKLETIYQQKLADLEELKKSILQKAFNGGLVPTPECHRPKVTRKHSVRDFAMRGSTGAQA